MNVYAVIPLLSFIAYCGLLVLALRRPLQRVHKTFALFLTTLALWGFVCFLTYTAVFPEHTLLLYKIIFICIMLLAASYYHFLRAFMNRPAGIGVKLGYGIVALCIPLAFTGHIIESASITSGLLEVELSPTIYPITLMILGLLGSAIFSLIQQYRHLKDALARSRITYILIGFTIMLSFTLTNLLPYLAKYPLANLGNLVNAFILTYAIQRYQLLDIRLVSRRGLAYSILAAFIIAIYLGLAFVIRILAPQWPSYGVALAGAVIVFPIVIVFQLARRKTLEWVDRRFFGETYDYRQFLLSYSDKMSNILNIGELAENMLDPITKALHTREASLLIPDTESGDFTTKFTYRADGVEPAANPYLRKDNPILTWLANEGKPLNVDSIDTIPELKGLWKDERHHLIDSKSELLVAHKEQRQAGWRPGADREEVR